MKHWKGALLALGVLLLPAAGMADLPRPERLEPEIGFWKRIFAEVSTTEALVHDNRELGIVYEKLSLPRSDSASRRMMEDAKQRYARILNQLAAGKRSGLGPDGERVQALWKGASADELREAAARVRVQQGLADRFRQGLVRSGRWEDHIRIQLRDAGVPESLAALPHVESSFNPEARSHVGAAGLWQFTTGTGRRFMQIDAAVDERRDPFRSSEAAARLLRANYGALGTWPLAITAYNHGVGGMRRAVREVGTTDIATIVRHYTGPAFGFASRNFYVSFLAAEELDRNAEQYFGPLRRDPPEEWRTVEVPDYLHISTIERTLGVSRELLRAYNPSLLQPVWSGRSYVPKGYALRLPADTEPTVAAERLAQIPAAERRSHQVADAGMHRVRRGETLSVIARKYGTTPATLAKLNGLKNSHMIREGQRLRLPGSSAAPSGTRSAANRSSAGGTYVVRQGDTLSTIAKRHGVSTASLARANGLSDRHLIRVGDRLRLPGGAAGTGDGGVEHYIVRRGDSLAAIARRTGVPQRRLMALNDLSNPNRIYPGQKLRLQGGG